MSATVEEYHPEVVAFVREFAELMDQESGNFIFALRGHMEAARYGHGLTHRERLIQFLLSECAKPLPKSEGVQ